MLTFTSKQIQERFDKLPKDLQVAVSSTEIHDSILNIGKKYGLHIDQLGEMVDLVGLTMLGLSPSKNFVRVFSQQTGVKIDIATSIAEDVNKEVFDKIRESMKTIEKEAEEKEEQTKNKQGISDLERIGGFTIEPPANLPGAKDVLESREALISQIESHTDIIVDNLLAGPTAAVEQKIEKTVEPPETKRPLAESIPKKPSDTDLYREPIA
jgi:hypothetical protein